jgi:hypothetical protein
MKKCVMSLLIFFCCGLTKTYAQSQEAKQLLLDVQKLASLKNILTDIIPSKIFLRAISIYTRHF